MATGCSSNDKTNVPDSGAGDASTASCAPRAFEGTPPAQASLPFTADACSQAELDNLAECASDTGCAVAQISTYCLKCAFGTTQDGQAYAGALDRDTLAVNATGCVANVDATTTTEAARLSGCETAACGHCAEDDRAACGTAAKTGLCAKYASDFQTKVDANPALKECYAKDGEADTAYGLRIVAKWCGPAPTTTPAAFR